MTPRIPPKSFDSNGNITSTIDAAGRTTGTEYDESGRPIAFIDPAGNSSSLEYDHFGNLIHTIDFLGNEIRYTYDNRGNRLTETRTVTNAAGIQEEIITRLAYDREDRIISI
ncbi:RHS repeat protein [Synechococcus sp. PCC 7336]|uniref:RHS repeat protein n=1 Tax=Synechococcus sp. PCC 7336 TaxID=195250 RepID=UPI0003485D51|nr:RHS repeat protein [Synechococcus sp. PCC 7336]